MQTIFAYTKQKASYGAVQNKYWRIIVLDSAYGCYELNADGTRKFVTSSGFMPETNASQPEQVADWLTNTVKLDDPADKRGLIILSHHQPVSAFDVKYEGTTKQLEKLLGGQNRSVVWLFGHEHRLAIYNETVLPRTSFVTFPRMIGNGGYADQRIAGTLPKRSAAPVMAFDERIYQNISTGMCLLAP